MKKVLILHNSTKTAYLFRYNYIKKLIESGHKVKLLSVSDDHLSEEKLKEIGVELVLIRKSRFSLLFFLYEVIISWSLGRCDHISFPSRNNVIIASSFYI